MKKDIGMIHVLKKRKLTLRKSSLDIVGEFDAIVIDKEIKKVRRRGNRTFLIYIEIPELKCSDVITVGTKSYNSAKIGQSYGKKIVIRNRKEPDFYIITNTDNPDSAIRSETLQSKLLFFVFLLIFPMFIYSVFLFIPFVFAIIQMLLEFIISIFKTIFGIFF